MIIKVKCWSVYEKIPERRSKTFCISIQYIQERKYILITE